MKVFLYCFSANLFLQVLVSMSFFLEPLPHNKIKANAWRERFPATNTRLYNLWSLFFFRNCVELLCEHADVRGCHSHNRRTNFVYEIRVPESDVRSCPQPQPQHTATATHFLQKNSISEVVSCQVAPSLSSELIFIFRLTYAVILCMCFSTCVKQKDMSKDMAIPNETDIIPQLRHMTQLLLLSVADRQRLTTRKLYKARSISQLSRATGQFQNGTN